MALVPRQSKKTSLGPDTAFFSLWPKHGNCQFSYPLKPFIRFYLRSQKINNVLPLCHQLQPTQQHLENYAPCIRCVILAILSHQSPQFPSDTRTALGTSLHVSALSATSFFLKLPIEYTFDPILCLRQHFLKVFTSLKLK